MRSDDDAVLHAFVMSRYPRLRRSAFLMCGDWAEAGRVVQDTLARVVADSRRGDVADPDTYTWAELMHTLISRSGRGKREHLFVAAPDSNGDAIFRYDGGTTFTPRTTSSPSPPCIASAHAVEPSLSCATGTASRSGRPPTSSA